MTDTIATYVDENDELEQLLSEIEGGYKVVFNRKEPPWAEESLGTVDFSPNNPISPDWIRNRFGGGVFAIKIKNASGQYITHRTISLKERPKNKQGQEIWPGPDGVPQTKEERMESTAKPAEPNNDGQNVMVSALKEIMDAQREQAAVVQRMLLDRVSSLERTLSDRQAQPVTPPLPGEPYDPHVQLQNTLKTMKMIDELKSNVTKGETEPEDINPMYLGIIEKLAEKFFQPRNRPAPGDQAPSLGPPAPKQQLSNFELAKLVKSRMSGMGEDEKEAIMTQVFGDEFWEEDENTGVSVDTGQSQPQQLNSLLSPEDQQQLNETTETGNAGEENPNGEHPESTS